ncbi:MAG: response regulator, partial [Magnetococcales bacterium]|nr:response regulator [Magnetococcales bacterium]
MNEESDSPAEDLTIKVLIVDDEIEIRKSISRFLVFHPAFQDVQVIHASGFQEAMEAVTQHRPLVVLQDINLPDGNGLQFIKHMKRAHPMIQFIVITGASDLDRVMDAVAYGAVDYIRKPMDLDALRQVVQEAIHRCQRWADLFRDEYWAEHEP